MDGCTPAGDGAIGVVSSCPVPELPEVEIIRRSLEPRLQGLRFEGVHGSGLGLRAPLDIEAWRGLLVGRTVAGVVRRGKFLLIEAADAIGVFHLGMSGRLLVAQDDTVRPPHTHLAAALTGGLELRFIDPRRFGLAIAMPASHAEIFRPLAELGPDALGDDCAAALDGRRGSRVAIRNVLLDQRVVAGIGNIYANEALYRARIRPATPMCQLGGRRIRRLSAAIRAVLEDAVRAGGTTLADGGFLDGNGEAGDFAVSLEVYGRAGQPCRRCDTVIARRALGGRSTYFCPRCQQR
jgi:formamidopyrimidine-DNA glycosylase